MFNFIYGFVIGGVVVGFLVGWMARGKLSSGILKPVRQAQGGQVQDDTNNTTTPYPSSKRRGEVPGLTEAEIEKAGNIQKVKLYLEGHSKITNGDIVKLLGVSDSTACRYLDDLENEGLIKQVGTDGPKVYYEKV